MNINPYLYFEGSCEEAIEFYKSKLGAEVSMLMRYSDMPPQPQNEDCGPMPPPEKIMHAEIRIGSSTVLMSDGRCQNKRNFEGFGLALYGSTDAEATKLFDALADGGEVSMPLSKTFFASSFGMVKDRFGVMWMILCLPKA